MSVISSIPETPETWCQIYSYMRGHGEMYIEVIGTNYYLFFATVRYFSGPTLWIGADFHLESTEQCLKRARMIAYFDDIDDQAISDSYRLYTLRRARNQVEIICGAMEIVDVLPEHLR